MGPRSVTRWIEALRQGDEEAARCLWERYFDKMMDMARQRLAQAPRREADEEDVALSAFDSLCRGVAAGRFTKLKDRNDLWCLLLALVRQKAVNQIRRQSAQKRGGKTIEEADFFELEEGSGEAEGALEPPIDKEPTPEELAILEDECRRLLGLLRNDVLRQIALRRMEGYANAEIAEELGVSERTVERKLRVIRDNWLGEVDQ